MSLLIFITISIILNFIYCDKLIFVSTHFRHGARAPMKVDSEYLDHAKEKWTNPGELTAIGQRMHYILGLRNRMRYITDTYHFLSEKFDSHEILIYSSAFNRTIVSAYAQLQGLYPEDEKLGLTLTESQEKFAVPDLKCDYLPIKEKIDKIKEYAMPNSMTLIPVRMINNNEKKITLYDIGECEKVRDEIKKKNRENLPIMIKMQKEFNENYGKILNDFYGEEKIYDYIFMNRLCDAVISSLIEGRNLTEFKKTGIDCDKMKVYCHEIQKMNYQEHILGDDEHILAYLEASKLMREIIHYMKKRIDIDITQEKIEEEYLDYSRPKMVMISGHDSTISCHQMFIINCLGFSDDYFRGAKYGAQLALEVTRRDSTLEEIKKMTYKDYILNYYFNDELLFNITVDEFIKKIEPKLWTDEQINDFCGFSNSNNNKKDDKKGNKLNSIELMILTILFALFIIFLTTTIVLCVKISKKKKETRESLTQISMSDKKYVNYCKQ